jgi:hypothetical protein
MLTAILIVAAALVLGGKDLWAKAAPLVAAIPRPELSWRQLAAAALLIGAVASFHLGSPVTPAPGPAPVPVGPLDLRGLFTGPTGAEDAAVVSALTGELAEEIEWDGNQDAPRWKTGVAVDELRQAARELRCRGVSIGSRQPAARDAIARHLEAAVGTSGGPITPEQRAAWVRSLREISEAAANVTR